MSVEFKIANKYLLSQRKRGFISFISLISMLGIILGVASLITVLSVMNGFHNELRDRILSAISHVNISQYNGKLDNWQDVNNTILKNKNVIASAPYIEQYALLTYSGKSKGVFIRGIVPKLEKDVSILLDKIKYGSLKLDKYQIILGSGLANSLGVSIKDKVILLTPQILSSIIGLTPKFKRFTVSAIFDAGIGEYNNNLAFIDINTANILYQMDSKVSGIRLKVDDMFKASSIANNILHSLADNKYYATDWIGQKQNFFRALQLEKQMIFLILVLIITIAAFNIVSMMVMVVTDKKADIAILRTIGMTPKRIVKVFLYQSLLIGLIGIIIGTGLGILIAQNVEVIVKFIESVLGFSFFPKTVFYINNFPSDLQLNDVINTILLAFILTVIASIYPAYKASKVNISEVLRYE